MITRNAIATELNNRGYHTSLQDTTKNGVIYEGIRIKKDDVQVISPVVYTDRIIADAMKQGKTLDCGLLFGDEKNKTFVGFQIKCFFDTITVLNESVRDKDMIKTV